jgi:hypothetical protein
MKGKKTYLFRCGCCFARDCREEQRRQVDLQEAAEALADHQERLGSKFEQMLFDNLWSLYAR